jgi:hypothetical protein
MLVVVGGGTEGNGTAVLCLHESHLTKSSTASSDLLGIRSHSLQEWRNCLMKTVTKVKGLSKRLS